MQVKTPYGLAPIWLRVNCLCPQCHDAGTGERLVIITELPPEVTVTDCRQSEGRYEIIFAPDGHRSVFDACWLFQYAHPGADTDVAGAYPAAAGPPDSVAEETAVGRTEDSKRLWSASEIVSTVPQGSWPLLRADAEHFQACLAAILRYGFVILRDVPAEPGAVLTVARLLGLLPEPRLRRIVDVQIQEKPENQAYTGQPLPPHTNQTFRDPLPSLELVHCLGESAGGGGDLVLVDGFHAAAALRARRPAAFAMLAGTGVTFSFVIDGTEITANKPVIGVNADGKIREIRADTTYLQPLRMPPADTVAFYAAYRAFAEETMRADNKAQLFLRRGDCVVFDNTRIMTGRTGFKAPRRIQIAWADLDQVASRLARMRGSRRNGHRYN